MDDDSVLIEIKNAEKKAKDIREKAASDKDSLINEARRMAVKMSADTEANAKSKADKMISDAEKKLKNEKEKLVTSSKKKYDESKKKALKNVDDATDFLSEKFLAKYK